MNHKPSRRDVLRTLAVGAGVAPSLAPLPGYFLPRAHAATTGAPRRIVFIDNPNGVERRAYATFLAKWTKGTPTSAFTLGPVMAPLEKYKELLTITAMLEFKKPPGYRDSSAHGVGLAMRLTGTAEQVPSPGRYIVPNPSVDHYLGKKLGALVTPKFPYLGLGVQSQGKTHTYGDDGTRIMNKQDVVQVYRTLFSDLVAGAPTVDAAAAARIARRKSVLDAVSKQLTAFTGRLGRDDRARAEAQLASLRTLENRLSGAMLGGGAQAGACAKPTGVPEKIDYMDSRLVPQLARIMNGMIASAFACDLTRVVTLQYYGGDEPNARVAWDPINLPAYAFHSLSHNDPSFEAYVKVKTAITGFIAELCDALAAIPEAGGTMLDNTLIFVGTECGDGHGHWGMPFYTIGGKNLGVKTNQYLELGTPSPGGGMEHNRLLVSFLNAMGLPDERYGAELMNGRGPVPGFFR